MMISLLRVAAVLAPASAYSSVMLGTSGCSRSLSAGTSIMGDSAVSSSDRTVSFDDHTCGGTYTSGDELTARISDTGNQFVFEVSGGVFEDGDCGGGRWARVREREGKRHWGKAMALGGRHARAQEACGGAGA